MNCYEETSFPLNSTTIVLDTSFEEQDQLLSENGHQTAAPVGNNDSYHSASPVSSEEHKHLLDPHAHIRDENPVPLSNPSFEGKPDSSENPSSHQDATNMMNVQLSQSFCGQSHLLDPHVKISSPQKKSGSICNKSIDQKQPRARLLSTESIFCRICHQGETEGNLIRPCKCTGTIGAIHQDCVEKWLGMAGSDNCEICGFDFITERKAKPFTEWLSDPGNPRDRKNVMTDGLCFLVLTPLATISTWLCVMGARHYHNEESDGYHWETVGLSTLTVFLILIYLIWCTVALRYHRRTFLRWRTKNQSVRVLDNQNYEEAPKALPHCSGRRISTACPPTLVTDSNNNTRTYASTISIAIPSPSHDNHSNCGTEKCPKSLITCTVCATRLSTRSSRLPGSRYHVIESEIALKRPRSFSDSIVNNSVRHQKFNVNLGFGSWFKLDKKDSFV